MLLTVPQAAERLNLSRQRVWLLVTQKRIKAQQVGQQWLIQESDLVRFRRNGRKPATGNRSRKPK